MPQIKERLNAMTYNEINHDSLDSVLNEILPELKGTIYSSIDGASTQDIGYLRRQRITDAIWNTEIISVTTFLKRKSGTMIN